MNKSTCVYVITAPPGKQYVGITWNKPESRWKEHSYRNCVIGHAIRKYGPDMKYEVVSHFSERAEACVEEIRLIKELNTQAPHGYNITAGGDSAFGDGLLLIRPIVKKYKKLSIGWINVAIKKLEKSIIISKRLIEKNEINLSPIELTRVGKLLLDSEKDLAALHTIHHQKQPVGIT